MFSSLLGSEVQVRRSAVLVVAVATALTILSMADVPAMAAEPTVDRLQGRDRFETAVAVVRRTWPDPAEVQTVYLATGVDFADALAAGPAAVRDGAPLLLTPPDHLPPAVAAELDRLDPARIVVVGGVAAIGPEVVADLVAAGRDVERVAGANRFDTAAQLALSGWGDGAPLVYVVTGLDFPDALATGPIAGAAGAPLLLVTGDAVPAETAAALSRLAVDDAVIVGGTAAVSAAAERQVRLLGIATSRVAGIDRYATAAAVSRPRAGVREIHVATGLDFPDALAGGPAAAADGGSVLLATPGALGRGTTDALTDLRPRRVTVLGGPAALDATTEGRIAEAVAPVRTLGEGVLPELMVSGTRTRVDGSVVPQSFYGATLDGRAEALWTTPPGARDSAHAWSPDGRLVAFVRTRTPPLGDDAPPVHAIWTVDLAVGPRSLEQVTELEGCATGWNGPRWSFDGAALLVECPVVDDGVTRAAEIGIVGLDGSVRSVQSPDGAEQLTARWSPDGRLLVVTLEPDDVVARLVDVDAVEDGVTGELVATEISRFDLAWAGREPDAALLHVGTADGVAELRSTVPGESAEVLIAGAIPGTEVLDWTVVDGTDGAALVRATQDGRDVLHMVGTDGAVTELVGPGSYVLDGGDVLNSPAFLDPGRVVVGQSVRGDDQVSLTAGRTVVIQVRSLRTTELLGDFDFVIPYLVRPPE